MWQSLLQQVLLVPAGIGQEGATWTTGVACAGPSRECKSASQAAWLEAAPPSGQRGRPSAGLGQRGASVQKGPRPLLSPPPGSHCPVRWETGKAAGPLPWAALVPAPPRAPRGGCPGLWHPRAAGSLGRREVPERALPAPVPLARPPGLSAGRSPLPAWTLLPLRGASPSGCRLPLSAEASTKWPPQPSAILCQRRAGGRPEGEAAGRPLHPPALGAWPEPSAAPPAPGLGQAALDLAPADILAGRSGAPAPHSAPPGLAPSGRRCCRPEPGGAVIKAMLLGSLGPVRTALAVTPARVGVARWTLCTGPGLSPAALGTTQHPPPSTGPLACPGPGWGASGFWCGRGYHVSSGSGQGLPGGGRCHRLAELPLGQLRSCS